MTGLAGIVAGDTAISTVGKEDAGLTYRGYNVKDLVEHSTLVEVMNRAATQFVQVRSIPETIEKNKRIQNERRQNAV